MRRINRIVVPAPEPLKIASRIVRSSNNQSQLPINLLADESCPSATKNSTLDSHKRISCKFNFWKLRLGVGNMLHSAQIVVDESQYYLPSLLTDIVWSKAKVRGVENR